MLNRALPPLVLLVLALLLLAPSALAQDAPPPPKPALAQAAEVRALFVANCAQCHGEKGDGEGVTQLDRKARSFLDGGFSYGNTREAILRSITHGIPGTPMPSFEKALTDAQRESLTQYVIAFGPDQIVVDPSESEMVVKDRPLIVRGKLPPIVEGAREWPRGLAIGTPDGLTFEYRADDVQLIGVRVGRFVNRADWGERGGAALEMLGRVVDTATYTRPNFVVGFLERETPELSCRLRATAIERGQAVVTYDLVYSGMGAPQVLATVEERPSVYVGRTMNSGYRRNLRITARQDLKRFDFVPAVRLSVHGPMADPGDYNLVWNYAGTNDMDKPDSAPLVVVRIKKGECSAVLAGGWAIGFVFEGLPIGATKELDVFVITNAPPQSRSKQAVVWEFGQP